MNVIVPVLKKPWRNKVVLKDVIKDRFPEAELTIFASNFADEYKEHFGIKEKN